MKTQILRNHRGQTVVEALVLSSATIGIFSLLASCIYLGWFYTCLQFISHEYLVCHASSNSPACFAEFQKQLKSISVFGEIHRPRIRQTSSQISIQLQLRWKLLGQRIVQLDHRDQIQLPLFPKKDSSPFSPSLFSH